MRELARRFPGDRLGLIAFALSAHFLLSFWFAESPVAFVVAITPIRWGSIPSSFARLRTIRIARCPSWSGAGCR